MNYSYWDEQRGKIKSKKGGWKIGKKVECHGLDMMEDVVGKFSYMQVVILNATGKIASKKLADWFEAIHICLSWPDSRVWCNRVGALGGSAGASSVASASAGLMAADSRSYGIRPIMDGVDFIKHAYNSVSCGVTIEEFVVHEINSKGGKPHLMGFARPVVKGDERIVVLERLSKRLGFERGEHLKLAYQIESILDRDFGESMNLNGYVSAFLSDQGYSAIDIYRIFSVVLSSGVVACSVDYADRDHGSFAPMRVDDIDYTGEEFRVIRG
jgi:citrate synthase